MYFTVYQVRLRSAWRTLKIKIQISHTKPNLVSAIAIVSHFNPQPPRGIQLLQPLLYSLKQKLQQISERIQECQATWRKNQPPPSAVARLKTLLSDPNICQIIYNCHDNLVAYTLILIFFSNQNYNALCFMDALRCHHLHFTINTYKLAFAALPFD